MNLESYSCAEHTIVNEVSSAHETGLPASAGPSFGVSGPSILDYYMLLERNSAWHTYNITRQTLFVIKRSRPAALCCCEHGRLSRYCNTLLRLWNFRSLEGSTVPLVPCIAKSSPVCKNKHGWYK